MERGSVHGPGFFMNGEDFPYRDTAASQIRLAPRKRITEGDAGKLGLEALFDDVTRD